MAKKRRRIKRRLRVDRILILLLILGIIGFGLYFGITHLFKSDDTDNSSSKPSVKEEDKTYEIDSEPELCKQGFHACLKLTDVFNYYCGELVKDIVVHEVELEGVSNETTEDDSKVVAKKITIGKRIL